MEKHLAIKDWTQNMLEGRKLTISHGEVELTGRPTRGCPQGGVLSPLLWSLVVNDLLKLLKEKGFSVFGYADDIAIIVRGNFLQILRERMMEALKIVQKWCQANGLTVNLSKTAAMVFTKKYKPESIEPLRLWG